jgi:molybdate transport system substrate-binding protein
MKTHSSKLKFALLLSMLSLASPLHATELRIAAAANIRFAMEELVAKFHANQPAIFATVTYGSSGTFYAQLQNQAPFDLFFSADMEYPRKLAEAGLALDNNVFFYAAGRLVVWTPKSSALEVETLGIQSLLAQSVKKIAIANPRSAPYGIAAVAAMKKLDVYQQAEPKLVFGENIAQAAQFVQSGAADIGIIALSLAITPEMHDAGRYWEVPDGTYPRLEQGVIILNWTKEAQAARAFRDFVLGEPGREVLARYGYFLPE